MRMWLPDLRATCSRSCIDAVLVKVDRRRQISVSSNKDKAEDSENGGYKSKVISFWSKMRNIGVLSSRDEDFIEALKRLPCRACALNLALRMFCSWWCSPAFGETNVTNGSVIMPFSFLFNCSEAVLKAEERVFQKTRARVPQNSSCLFRLPD